jgi:hypothetical protein
MVQEAEALEKPGRPTFFETPAWSFNMGGSFCVRIWVDGGNEFASAIHERAIWTAALISPPP